MKNIMRRLKRVKLKRCNILTCEDCIHYDICIFHLKGDENKKCEHFISTIKIAPKSEVAKEIIEMVKCDAEKYANNIMLKKGIRNMLGVMFDDFIIKLKKKYEVKDDERM